MKCTSFCVLHGNLYSADSTISQLLTCYIECQSIEYKVKYIIKFVHFCVHGCKTKSVIFISHVIALLLKDLLVRTYSSGVNFNPHLLNGPVQPYQLDESISNFRGVWCTFSFLFCFEYMFLLANSEDPDQMPLRIYIPVSKQ